VGTAPTPGSHIPSSPALGIGQQVGTTPCCRTCRRPLTGKGAAGLFCQYERCGDWRVQARMPPHMEGM
jgi:hypothetical protein